MKSWNTGLRKTLVAVENHDRSAAPLQGSGRVGYPNRAMAAVQHPCKRANQVYMGSACCRDTWARQVSCWSSHNAGHYLSALNRRGHANPVRVPAWQRCRYPACTPCAKLTDSTRGLLLRTCCCSGCSSLSAGSAPRAAELRLQNHGLTVPDAFALLDRTDGHKHRVGPREACPDRTRCSTLAKMCHICNHMGMQTRHGNIHPP